MNSEPVNSTIRSSSRSGTQRAASGSVETAFVFPISFAQQRLWLVDQITTNKTAYNMSVAFELRGALDIEALEIALNDVVRRHEILRTTFQSNNGQPAQVIAPRLSLKINRIDLKSLPDKDLHTQAIERLNAEAQLPFDLAAGPLFRISVVEIGPQENFLLISMHHIISDDLSISVLTKEIEDLYAATRSKTTTILPQLSIQYADYAVWQIDQLQNHTLEKQLSFWKNQLEGLNADLPLPTDKPRPIVRTFRGAKESRRIPQSLSDKLNSLGQEEGATPFTISLAAFYVLLFRYTNQTDIAVGSPITNRTESGLHNLIGFFLNTLVMRTDLSGSPSFREILSRVRTTCLDAFGNRDLPFEKIVQALHPERNLSHNPLFQVMFVYQENSLGSLRFQGLESRPIELKNNTSKLDLTLFMEPSSQGTLISFEYDTDLFDQTTIQRMAVNFEQLLQSIVANPDIPVIQLNWLNTLEKEKILHRWNNTSSDYPKNRCIHEWFEERAKQSPTSTALISEGREITYGQLNGDANKVAALLKANGVLPGSFVGICGERSAETIAGVIAILKAGAAYVPLDPNYPADRLMYMLENSGAKILLARKNSPSLPMPPGLKLVYLDAIHTDSSIEPGAPSSPITPDHPAYVIYTSGSTGKPKGVVMGHRALVNLLHWQLGRSGLPSTARTIQFTSLSFDVSFQEIFATLCSGSALVLVPEELRADPSAFLIFLNKNKIERLFLPFVALQSLAEVARDNKDIPTTLRQIITAGEQLQITPAVAAFMAKLPGCVLQNQYGPTESHVCIAHTLKGPIAEWPILPPIGKPIDNTQIYLLDQCGQPVPTGAPGELHIGGDCLAQGYLNRPDLTSERFIPNPFNSRPNARLYKTGDLARWLADGSIEFLGRIDHQVKIRGFRVELGEIEVALARHPEVKEAVVVARDSAAGSKRLVAYVVLQTDATTEAEKLRSFIKAGLPDYMVPSAFVVLDSLPLTPTGKINRRALPAPTQDSHGIGVHVPPRDEREEKLALIFSEILELDKVGIHDNFFEIGGHSLAAVKVFSRIKSDLGSHIPLSTIFGAPTIEQLAGIIAQEKSGAGWSTLVPIQPNGSQLPIFWVHTLGGGGGGGLFRYKYLAELLGPDQPSYGIQAPSEPFTVIENMAENYIQLIKTLQPKGPYHLMGYCFGGNVACEMARQLQNQGQNVAFLGVIDAEAFTPTSFPPHPRNFTTVKNFLVNLYYWLRDLIGQKPTYHWILLKRTFQRLQRMINARADQPMEIPELDEVINLTDYPQDFRRYAETHWNAMLNYRPLPYDGPMTVFRVRRQALMLFEPTLGWSYLVKSGLKVIIAPGVHETVFDKPNVQGLAKQLKAAIEDSRSA